MKHCASVPDFVLGIIIPCTPLFLHICDAFYNHIVYEYSSNPCHRVSIISSNCTRTYALQTTTNGQEQMLQSNSTNSITDLTLQETRGGSARRRYSYASSVVSTVTLVVLYCAVRQRLIEYTRKLHVALLILSVDSPTLFDDWRQIPTCTLCAFRQTFLGQNERNIWIVQLHGLTAHYCTITGFQEKLLNNQRHE
ncbi:hypothetical protein T265_13586, partial [Opisthorchis viverrini]